MVAKSPNRLWIVVLLLGWSFDFLFWGRSLGINFAIFTALCLLGGFYVLVANGLRPAAKSLWLLAPIVFFAFIAILRREPLTSFLAYTFTGFSMGLLAVTYSGGRWIQYGLLDYFSRFFHLTVISMLVSPIEFFVQVRKERAERGGMGKRLPVGPVLRGLLIAIPIVAFFAFLLTSADVVFSQKLAAFLGLFDSSRIYEYISRLILILFCAYLLAGVFLHAALHSSNEELLGEEKPVVKSFLGFTESAIVLGSVAILFLSFVLIQFRYFFGGEVNIGVEGYTYSEYARSGFNELVAVAFFSLLMILGLSTVTRRENDVQRRVYSGLSVAIAALVMVILVSSYQRLTLAILWHGFSRLRLYPRVFLIWVGILFTVVVVLEIFHRERHFAFAALLASLGFAVSLSLLNVDASIVRHNVMRASQGRHFNVAYLASLSTDAVPALADEFLDPTLPTSVHEGVGAALLCYLHAAPDVPPSDWLSNNLSRWLADRALERVQALLDEYNVNVKGRFVRVRTPGNVLYPCRDE